MRSIPPSGENRHEADTTTSQSASCWRIRSMPAFHEAGTPWLCTVLSMTCVCALKAGCMDCRAVQV